MKASPFRYVCADSAEQAVAELVQVGPDARLIAGGQSLVPMMAMRLALPTVLVDINRLPLDSFDAAKSWLTTGATLSQAQFQREPAVANLVPLAAAAMPWVGHQQTRNRGTVGGSLTQADPSAELPLVAAVLNAQLVVLGANNTTRQIDASDFYLGPMQTTLGDDEMLMQIQWPVWQPSQGGVSAVFDEVAIRHGDFAMASAACQLQVDGDGTVRQAAMGLGGVDAIPKSFPNLADQIIGARVTEQIALEIAANAAQACDPGTDMHASGAYRRNLARTLLSRALLKAYEQAYEQAADNA